MNVTTATTKRRGSTSEAALPQSPAAPRIPVEGRTVGTRLAASVFLSHAWKDKRRGVDILDRQLLLRGVPTYRDVRELGWGSGLEGQLREALESRCAGFVLYATPHVLASRTILEVELAAMDDRRRRDRKFFAGAVFRDLAVRAGSAQIHSKSGVDVGSALGSITSDKSPLAPQLAHAAAQILREYLRARWHDGPAIARLETRNAIPNDEAALLHLAWSPPLEHDAAAIKEKCWNGELLPALADLRRELEWRAGTEPSCERGLHLAGNVHQSAALALGYEFREASGWQLEIASNGSTWTTRREAPDATGFTITTTPGDLSADALVVCVSIAQDVCPLVRAHRKEIGPARAELRLEPTNGASRVALETAQANGLAAAIAGEIREAARKYQTRETHLFIAGPWPFAALLGWHLGSSGVIVAHEATPDQKGYVTTCRLT